MLKNYLKHHLLLSILVCLFNTTYLAAQQDCITAIPICQDVYFELNSYDSVGTIDELIGGFNTSCLNGGEDNSVWYIFTVAAPGSFEFQITPNAINDDYDWAIFDLTNSDCSSILNGTAPEPRCNYSAIPGSTGLSNPYTLTSVPQGGPNQCAPMNVIVGETYVLMVNNFAGSLDGYTLTLSGTAVIYDTIAPKAVSIDPFPCYPPDTLHVTFSEPVTCISTAPDGSDFQIYGPASPDIIAANSINCISGLFTTDIYLVLASPITLNGDYTLRFQLGLDGNIVLDNCGNEMSFLDSLPFTVAIADAEFDYLLDKTCFGDSLVFFNSSVGDTINSITWDFGDGSSSTEFNPTHNYSATGSYTVTLSIADTGGCFDDTTVQIDAYVEPPVAAFTVSSPPYCVNVPVSFTNSSTGQGLSYEWQFGTAATTNDQDPDFNFLNEGLFTILLTAMDSIGCTDSASANLSINTGVIADFLFTPESLCVGDTIQFSNVSAGNAIGVNWDFGNGISDTSSAGLNIVYQNSGAYTVTLIVQDSVCLPDTVSKEIIVFDYPIVNLGPDTSICIEENFSLNAGNPGYAHNWSTGETTQTIVVKQAPQTLIVLVDNNGCVGKDTVFVDSSCPFFIPTAFTPNGDGINDEYKIITNGATAFRMAIYNRWGERIFITKDGSKGWDGTFEGKPEEMGTYIYELQVVFDNGVSRVSKGNITLIR